jgi:hypothetical protein
MLEVDRLRLIVETNREAGSIALMAKVRIRQNINDSPLLLLMRLVQSLGPVTTEGMGDELLVL